MTPSPTVNSQAASKLGLKTLVGLQLVSMANVNATAATYQALASDLHASYGNEPSFRGFYLTQEWEPPSYVGRADEIGRDFIGPISDHIHRLDPSLEVGMSPSLTDTITWAPCPAAWYTDHGDYIASCSELTPTLHDHVATPVSGPSGGALPSRTRRTLRGSLCKTTEAGSSRRSTLPHTTRR